MVFGKFPPPRYDRLATTEHAGALSEADYSKLAAYPALPALVALARTVVPAGGVASISFASIPAGYRNLQLRVYGRGTAAAYNIGVYVQFNGDSTANYDRQYQVTYATTIAAGESVATATAVVGHISAANAVAGCASGFAAEIFDYSGPWRKMVTAQNGIKELDTSGGTYFVFNTVGWRSTAAITSILLAPISGSFAENTVAVLYGLRDT